MCKYLLYALVLVFANSSKYIFMNTPFHENVFIMYTGFRWNIDLLKLKIKLLLIIYCFGLLHIPLTAYKHACLFWKY